MTEGLSMKNKTSKKLQSAMEYLMTYGWAILIIAVVIGVLYALGIFNGSGFLGSFCTAQTGYFCANPILSTNSPTLNVTIGQDTRLEWPAWKIFAVRGTAFNASSPNITGSGAFYNGEKQIVTIPLNSILGNYIPIGTPLSGSLWVEYCNTPNCNTPDQVSEIGIFSIKAAKLGYVTTSVSTTSLSTISTTSTATTAPTTTITPSGIIYSVPITLTNPQSSNTPAPFQQMVNISESAYSQYLTYNGNFANFEYFTLSGNTVNVLPGWIESNNLGKLTTWVKLPNGIPAESSITIYLGFASTSTNLLSSSGTTGIGEAPQLSSTYGQYDDGASVFNFYDNFAGTSLNTSKWSNVGSSGTAGSTSGISVNNGLALTGGGTGGLTHQTWIRTSLTSGSFTSALVTDVYENSPSTSTTFRWGLTNSNPTYFGGTSTNSIGEQIWDDGNWFTDTDNGASSGIQNEIGSWSSLANTYVIWSIAATSSQVLFYNPNTYSSLSSSGQTITTTIPAYSSSIGLSLTNDYINPIYVKWARVRAYPPNGVMPTENFKQIQNITYINATPNPAPYEQNIVITATCPIGNICTIQFPLGTTLATGTTTATYEIIGGSAEDAPGDYIYYANDINTGKTATTNLVIANQLPLLYTVPGNYTFTVPSNVISLIITAVAGGAGGTGGLTGSGGGSGWSVVNKSYNVIPCEHIPITVGVPGGSVGGDTIIGNLVTLQGAIGSTGQVDGNGGYTVPNGYYGGNGASADPGYPFGIGGYGGFECVESGCSSPSTSASGYGSGGGGQGGSGSGGEVIITNFTKGSGICHPTPILYIYSTPVEHEQNITIKSAVYEQNINVTATCPIGDTCTIQSPLGKIVATGTTNVAYEIIGGSAEDAPGIYTYYAKDISTGTITSKNITILPLPYTVPGNYIFTVPSNVISLTITAVAGGAGGTGGSTGSGGGSGWSVVNKSYNVIPYERIPITVGAPGGSVGGDTIIGNLVTLQGAIGSTGQVDGNGGYTASNGYYGGNGASADPGYPFGIGGYGGFECVESGCSSPPTSASGYGSGGGGQGGSGSGGEVIITNMSK